MRMMESLGGLPEARRLATTEGQSPRTPPEELKSNDDVYNVTHGHNTPMGAAPGITTHVTSRKNLTLDTFRRGKFPLEDPKGTFDWTVSKWKRHLELEVFNPKDEWDMENWFEKNGAHIRAAEITAYTLVRVMMSAAKPEIVQLFDELWIDLVKCEYVEDVADVIAKTYFPGDSTLLRVEKRILNESTRGSVREAMASLSRRLNNYFFMCERKGRTPAISEHQKINILLDTMPLKVHKEVMRATRCRTLAYHSLCEMALEFEELTKRLVTPTGVVQGVFAVHGIDRPTAPCSGCASLAHFKKDCPHRKDRCVKCGVIGHISPACKNTTIADKAGRTRILLEQKKTGLRTSNLLDQDRPAQTKTMYGTVGKTLADQEHARGKAREKYAEKRQKEGKELKKKRTIPALHVDAEPIGNDEDGGESTPIQAPDDDEQSNDSDGLGWLARTEEEVIPKVKQHKAAAKNKLMILEGFLNGKSTPLTLDTGATMNCIAEKLAITLGLETSGDRRIRISGIGAKEESARATVPVLVTIDGDHVVATEFAVLQSEVPTLIGRETLGALDLILDPKRGEAISPTKTHKCYAVENKDELRPKTLQQSDFSSAEEEVKVEQEKLRMDPELTESTIEALGKELLTFREVWFNPKAGLCTTVKLDIKSIGSPKRQKVRPVPGHLKEELNKQIKDLEEAKLIRKEPRCPWTSPVHLVPKPRSDKWRLVIDYRYVNTQIVDDGYPLPRIDEILMRMRNHKWFTLIDLNWGFWNVSLEERAKEFTGFVVPDKGVYVWNVMPFGLKTSPTVFQRAIEIALEPLISLDKVQVYIDDIIISTITQEENIIRLREVLTLLKENGFFVNFKKASFLKKEALILGHYVSFNTLKPDPQKIQGIVSATNPKTKSDI